MEKKPITTFLKVMSIIILIQSVFGILINGLAAFMAPLMEEAGGEVGAFAWISIAVSTVCLIINFVLALLALQHKKLDIAYKLAIVTLIFPLVFNVVSAAGASGFVSAVANAVLPALFCYALFQQNKLDKAQ